MVVLAMLRVISERHLAAMVVKGICQFPENGDRLGGTIDIWWIVRIFHAKCFAIIRQLCRPKYGPTRDWKITESVCSEKHTLT